MLPNRNEAMKSKKLIHQSEHAHYMAYGKDDAGKAIVRVFYGALNKNWPEISQLNKEGCNIFMLVNSVPGKKRTSEQVNKVNAVFIDYDEGDWSEEYVKRFIKECPLSPHMVIQSSPGRFHIYWLVADAPLDKFKVVQQKLAVKYKTDRSVCDLSRVMRMPGTINWKRESPFLAHIVYTAENVESIPYRLFCNKMFSEGAPAQAKDGGGVTAVASPKSVEGDDLVQRVIEALQIIPADDRKIWVTVGMALCDAFGHEGLPMFRDWSSKSSKYNEQELSRQWESFKPGGGIKIGTLFWLAKSFSTKTLVGDKNMPTVANLLALGEHFGQVSQPQLRYCEAENLFMVCVNGKWTSSSKLAERMAISYLQNLSAVAAQIKDDVLQNFIGRSQTLASARELLRAAESDPSLKVNSAVFDAAPNILAAKRPDIPDAIERHAVIRLDQKRSRSAEADDMVMRIAGAAYDSKAKCPQWMVFLDQITEGDTDLAEFLQLAVGYTFYGHTKEQVMFVLIGSGGNGKGIFARIIFKLLGDYAVVMQSGLLKPGAISGNSPSPALMKLRSKRFWLCSEVPKGMVLDEALVKQITGGDIVSTRQLYGHQMEFLPVGKLWLLVNDMPRVRHDDKGMWRRIIPIPFSADFTGSNRDNDLEGNLQAELSGILNWALEGARKYATAGKLEQPVASKKLLSALRRDVDTVGLWIKARCLVNDEGKMQSKIAYDDYCDTMKREKATHLPQKEFKADLVRRGHAHKVGRYHNYFVGISIKAG